MLKVEIFTVFILLMFGSFAHAKDVSLQQTGFNNALQKMERAEAEYNSDAQAVAEIEKLIAKKNNQLAEERKKADLSKSKLLEAKEKLEQAQVILDKAWKE